MLCLFAIDAPVDGKNILLLAQIPLRQGQYISYLIE